MFDLKFDSEEAEKISLSITSASREISSRMNEQGPALAEVAEAFIRHSISAIPDIGEFMAARTAVDKTYAPGVVTLTIRGMTEGEAGFPGVSGGTPSSEMNLWNRIEFGSSDDGGGDTTYVKDVGGVTASRKSRAAGVGSKRQGAIADTISSIITQLNAALSAAWGTAGAMTAASVVSKATRGKGIRVPKTAMAAMSAAGLDRDSLIALGVTGVNVTSSGQIIAKGAGGRFISMKSRGIPTTIRTR